MLGIPAVIYPAELRRADSARSRAHRVSNGACPVVMQLHYRPKMIQSTSTPFEYCSVSLAAFFFWVEIKQNKNISQKDQREVSISFRFHRFLVSRRKAIGSRNLWHTRWRLMDGRIWYMEDFFFVFVFSISSANLPHCTFKFFRAWRATRISFSFGTSLWDSSAATWRNNLSSGALLGIYLDRVAKEPTAAAASKKNKKKKKKKKRQHGERNARMRQPISPGYYEWSIPTPSILFQRCSKLLLFFAGAPTVSKAYLNRNIKAQRQFLDGPDVHIYM